MSELMLQLASQTGYNLTESTWEETKAEIHRVKALIESNAELTPEDVKDVTQFAKKIQDLGANYKKAINKTAKDYNDYLTALLSAEGYDVIVDFIEQKKKAHQLEVSERINEKVTQYRDIIDSELMSHPLVSSTSLKDVVYNAFLSRFPNISSGDKRKIIKDWDAIRLVVKTHVLKDYPIISQLPAGSHSLMALTEYLKISAEYGLQNISAILQQDRTLIEQIALRQQVPTADAAVQLIMQVLQSDVTTEEKLSQIQQVLTAHSANKVM